MGWIRRVIFKKVLSEWVPFKWIDGHKKEISRVAAFLSAILLAGQHFFPEIPYFTMVNAQLTAVLSLLGIALAEAHDDIKLKNNFGK